MSFIATCVVRACSKAYERELKKLVDKGHVDDEDSRELAKSKARKSLTPTVTPTKPAAPSMSSPISMLSTATSMDATPTPIPQAPVPVAAAAATTVSPIVASPASAPIVASPSSVPKPIVASPHSTVKVDSVDLTTTPPASPATSSTPTSTVATPIQLSSSSSVPIPSRLEQQQTGFLRSSVAPIFTAMRTSPPTMATTPSKNRSAEATEESYQVIIPHFYTLNICEDFYTLQLTAGCLTSILLRCSCISPLFRVLIGVAQSLCQNAPRIELQVAL